MCIRDRDILRQYKQKHGNDFAAFPEEYAIQLNDTHPVVSIAELVRLLAEEGVPFGRALKIARQTFAYTNHTIMAEALEKWDVRLFKSVIPQVYRYVVMIDKALQKELDGKGIQGEAQAPYRIIDGGMIHMARMAIFATHSTNGVAKIHTEILKNTALNEWYRLYPERFNNKTNGITQRRWLALCNQELSGFITGKIGSGWITDLTKLKGLEAFQEDAEFLRQFAEIKQMKKQELAAYVEKHDGVRLDPNFLFDIQAKRLHEYKRQLLCAMRITQLQLLLHDDPDRPFQPRTFLFAAKAAPGYAVAKRIIQLLCSLAADVNADPVCRGRLQVYFLPNYRVSAAEMLMPAAQVSEQISTAGKEASGTGNMKLMMNGAVTIGTLDGANVEMFEQLGADNMFLFGLHADEAEALRAAGYDPQAYVRRSPWLGRVLERMSRGYADGESYADLVSSLLYGGDPYLLLADFDDYAATHERLYTTIADPAVRARLSLVNIARSGIFAADRAVREYAERIWEVHA